MKPAADLNSALASMRFRVREERFALAGIEPKELPRALDALSRAGPDPFAQIVLEGDVVTLLAGEAAVADLPGARVERGYRLITFDTPMTWDVVGFLARVTGALADGGVPLGAVCGFDRDHLFVREPFLERARALLRERVCPEA